MSFEKDAKRALRTAYITRLKDNISIDIGGVPTTIKVLNKMPNTNDFPYVVIGSQTSIPNNVKDVFCREHTMFVKIITGFDGNDGGDAQADDIADEIYRLIRTTSDGYMDLSADGFNIITIVAENDQNIEPKDSGDHQMFQRIIPFSHMIEQL